MKTAENWPEIVAQKDARLAEKDARIVELEALVKYYETQFRLAKHRQFGASSEKSEYDQVHLFNEAEATADTSAAEPELTEVAKHYRKRKRLVNDRLPEDLPVEVIERDLPEEEQSCPQCGGSMHVCGHEKRRELVIIPAQVKIREHVRKVYACRSCERNEENVPVIKAPVDNPVIKGSFASPESIAHTMCQKFVMGSPLYRQEQEWNRQGIMLSRQTMSNWLLTATELWLEPIYKALIKQLMAYDVLHADETTLQVLHEPGKTPQSKSYMWLYRTSGYDKHSAAVQHPIVLYEYQPDRKGKHPAEFLKDYKGYLHTDGYEAYHNLQNEIVVVGCMAHVRRKFDEGLKSLPERDRSGSNVLRGKRYCDKLFDLEQKFADLTPDERLKQRQLQAKPLLKEFFAWLSSLRAAPKTPIGVAASYALGQREYLERYLLDGRLEISNRYPKIRAARSAVFAESENYEIAQSAR